MIDEDWLRQLDFVGLHGLHYQGIVGLGSESVVFGATDSNGQRLVVKTRRHHLGYHIKEIPLHLSGKPLYDVDRLNRKLAQLLGNNDFDQMTCEYDRLFSSLLNILHGAAKSGGPAGSMGALIPLLGAFVAPVSPEALPFMLATPMMRRRLEEIATLSPLDPDDSATWMPAVNGPNFPIRDTPDRLREWAQSLLAVSRDDLRADPLEPATLTENPLFIWGAAAMDGFLVDDELPRVVEFIEGSFGRLPAHARAGVWIGQATAVCDLLACALKQSEVERLVVLCGMLGFMFDVHDGAGNVVASSMGYLKRT